MDHPDHQPENQHGHESGMDGYFKSRLEADERRGVLWETLCKHVFQKYVPPDGTVVELGAARADFINRIQAHRRVAVDRWPGLINYAAEGVEAKVGRATDLEFLRSDTVDLLFASNLLEHMELEEITLVLREAKRVLKQGGRFVVMQPNFRNSFRRYFDDYTHVSIWSHVSLGDFLQAEGFVIERVLPRFLPLTIKSRLPVHPFLIRFYLRSPIKPFAGQMLIVASLGSLGGVSKS